MARPRAAFPVGSESAALKFLADIGEPVNSSDPGYIRRVANRLQWQLDKGLPLSRPAARGHRITPEHPNRRRPILPAPAEQYAGPRARPSRYRRHTAPLERSKLPAGLRPQITRPRTHNRGRIEPPLSIPGVAEVHTYKTGREAQREVMRIYREHPRDRVYFDVFDCSLGRWGSVYTNRRHNAGVTVAHLVDEMDGRGFNLEEMLITDAGEGESEGQAPRLSHICLFVMVHIPAERPARRSDRSA